MALALDDLLAASFSLVLQLSNGIEMLRLKHETRTPTTSKLLLPLSGDDDDFELALVLLIFFLHDACRRVVSPSLSNLRLLLSTTINGKCTIKDPPSSRFLSLLAGTVNDNGGASISIVRDLSNSS